MIPLPLVVKLFLLDSSVFPVRSLVLLLLLAFGMAPSAAELTVAEIDRLVASGWTKGKVRPAEPADDSEFLRRLSLDLRGRIPDPSEAAEFLADETPNKRTRKIDEIIKSEEFAGYWSILWAQILTGKPIADRFYGYYLFQEYLRQALLRDQPFDRLASEIIGADGWIDKRPSVFFNYRWRDPQDLAAATSRIFLGVQIRCAQCHNHPFDQWKSQDFWGFAAFFARTTIYFSERGEKFYDGDGNEYDRYRMYEESSGEVADRLSTGQHPVNLPTRFLASAAPAPRTAHRRKLLAKWIASKDNPWFSRAIVNRVWGHFMGRGFVHPVDNFTVEGQPSHPDLLDRWARDFAHGGFRLRRLIRQITLTRAYQLDCRIEGERPKEELFAVAPRKRLTSLQLFMSIAQATGIEYDLKEATTISGTEGGEMENPETAEEQPGDSGESGEQAGEVDITMSEADYHSEFNVISPIETVLLQFNSTLVSHGLLVGWQIQGVMGNESLPENRIDWLFLSSLSRYPTDDEKAFFLELVKGTPDDPETYQRILWVLLNSTEFSYKH